MNPQENSIELDLVDDKPIARRLWVAAIILLSFVIAFPYLTRPINDAKRETRHRINRASLGAFVTHVGLIADDKFLRIQHPLSALQVRARIIASDNESRSRTWDAVLADKSLGTIRGLGDKQGIDSFVTALAVLRLMGYDSEEARLLKVALRYRGEARFARWEVVRWLELGYTNVALQHFQRREYFLGLAAVREALRQARLQPIPNLNGTDGLSGLVSPLIIVDAYFPDTLTEATVAVDYAALAALVLDDDYESISSASEDEGQVVFEPLRTYARGVLQLREERFADAASTFAIAESLAPTLASRDLSRFMAVRSSFWEAHGALQQISGLLSGEEVQREVTKELRQEDQVEVQKSQEERNFQLIARAFVQEMKRAGVLRAAPIAPRVAATVSPEAGSGKIDPREEARQVAEQKLAQAKCSSSRQDLRSRLATIEAPFWRSQGADYLRALENFCAKVGG